MPKAIRRSKPAFPLTSRRLQARARLGAGLAGLVALVLVTGTSQVSAAGAAPPTTSVVFTAASAAGGAVPAHYVGLSVEWSLIERYMGPNARPAFVNLLKNLGTGILRIGGSSQDQTPFDATAVNTNRVITPEDLSFIRSTLDAVNAGAASPQAGRPAWGVVLGTAMSPPTASRPFVSPEHAHAFVTQGVNPVFGDAPQLVAGIELGNEPDLSYGSNLERYLSDLTIYSDPAVTGPWPIIAPNTSEDILPWQSIDGRTVPTRYFWDWPRILDTVGPEMTARAGSFPAYASDHFYPLARTCANRPYRCPTISALLSDEHMNSLDYQVYVHSQESTRHGLGYRLEETNTAAGRGADGVSNVAASATYGLDAMFHNACPQPPQSPGANDSCGTGGIGINFHNAEVRAFYFPEEGNAYYNAINYDPTAAMGAPTATPLYYSMLLFSRVAQGANGLRPVAVSTSDSSVSRVKAWRVEGPGTQSRMFLINKSDHPVTLNVSVAADSVLLDRMSPYDPTGTDKTLDASQVRIDGQQVAADGTWPGFKPVYRATPRHQLTITLTPGEAQLLTQNAAA